MTLPSIIGVNGLYNQPTIKSFDDLTKKATERKRKERKKRKEKGKPRKNQREKEKEKREKGRGEPRQQGEKKEKGHGSKEKEEKVTTSHHGQPRAAVGATVVSNAVSRQNRLFLAVLNIASKAFL